MNACRCLPATHLPVKTNLENPDEIRTCGMDNFRDEKLDYFRDYFSQIIIFRN